MAGWTAADLPRLDGRVAVVTGANSGLGLVTARELARAGASVVLACRDAGKASAAAAAMTGSVSVAALDLASLHSVAAFASEFLAAHDRLDLLICNAGVMAPPRGVTADGFERQFGTNHLGHFALCGRLLPALLAAAGGDGARDGPRVVTVSSGMHRLGWMRWADLQGERRYGRWLAYGQSKLANLLFCFELARRLTAARTDVESLAAHPGYASTHLQSSGPPGWEAAILQVSNRLFAQSAEMGALPTLYAACAPGLPNGSFVGPDGPFEGRGHPHVVGAAGRAYDEADGRRLWELSEELTGVTYAFPAAAA